MKRFKKLGILLGVLVVICIATFALTRYEEEQEQIRSAEEIVLEIPADTVTALSWEYEDENSLAFHKEEDGWSYEGDAAFPVSQEKVDGILSEFEAFGVTFIIENVEDYSQYGLDQPECTFHITAGETVHDIKLGAFSTMDQQRYVDIGDGNVYLVSEDPMDYVSPSLSDMICNDDLPGFETVIDIRFEGSENYIIQRMEDTDYSYSEEDVYFVQRDGKYLPLDTAAVAQYLNTITSLDLSSYATYNATAEELASYGLDTPELSVTVNYSYTDEESEEGDQISDTCLIHIGRDPEDVAAAAEAEANEETPEPISMYIRIGDSQIVYDLDTVNYAILADASYDDLRHGEVFWGDFADVTRIDITLEDADHTLIRETGEEEEILWFYQTEETDAPAAEEAEAPTEGTEETVPEEDAPEALDLTDLETSLNALFANSFTADVPTGMEELRMTLHLDHDAFPTVEIALNRHDGSECLAVIDGKPVSLVPRSSVMALVEAVQTIVLNHQ